MAAIYNEGIAEREATFETRPRRGRRGRGVDGRADCRCSSPRSTAASSGSPRSGPTPSAGVRGIGEHAVYVAGDARRQGVGRALLEALGRGGQRRRALQADLADLRPPTRRRSPLHESTGFTHRRRAAPPRPARRRVAGLRARRAPAGRRRGGTPAPAGQPARASVTRSASRRPRRVRTARPSRAQRLGLEQPVGDASCARGRARVARERRRARSPSRSRTSSITRSSRAASAPGVSRAGRGRAARGEPRAPGARVQDVPPAHAADVAVRAGPDAPPVAAAPVAEVVAAAGGRGRAPSWQISYQRSPAAASSALGDLVAVGDARRRRARAARRGGPARPGRVPGSTISE